MIKKEKNLTKLTCKYQKYNNKNKYQNYRLTQLNKYKINILIKKLIKKKNKKIKKIIFL